MDNLELQKMLEKQEQDLLEFLATIRKQMEYIRNKEKLFRLYINHYTKKPTYYAHLFDNNGRQTDVRISCKTTDKEQAKLYALKYREKFLNKYFAKKNKTDFYNLLKNYYTEKSDLFKKAQKKRNIREKQIKGYKAFIDNYFIPFLETRKITTIEKANNIDLLEFFQDYCQDEKLNGKYSLSAKTINSNISCSIAPIFNQILREKSIFILNKNINIKDNKRKSIGLIPIRTTFSILLNDFFWAKEKKTEKGKTPFLTYKIKNIEKYRLYCLLGNLCGLRNAEILFLKKTNIILIGKTYFLNIENSRLDETGTKTEAGKRLVPLHHFVYKKI
jgi:hypothetical protein